MDGLSDGVGGWSASSTGLDLRACTHRAAREGACGAKAPAAEILFRARLRHRVEVTRIATTQGGSSGDAYPPLRHLR